MSGFALFAFLLTWIREIIKDLQDQTGDRELECHTLPIVLGEWWTKIILTILIIAAIGFLSYFAFTLAKTVPYTLTAAAILVVLMIVELCFIWAAKIPTDYRRAQLFMKLIMLLGVLYGLFVQL